MAEKKGTKKVQAPLLKAYLRKVPGHPPHVPAWVFPASWGVGLGSAVLLGAAFDLGMIGIGAAVATGYAAFYVLRDRFKARTDQERADEASYSAISKMKRLLDQSAGFERRFPPEVLLALESAVATHNATIARSHGHDPVYAVEQAEAAQKALHACFVAAGMVIREDQQSKKDWNAILSNRSLIGDVVEAIERQKDRMGNPSPLDSERLAALKELEFLQDAQQDVHLRG